MARRAVHYVGNRDVRWMIAVTFLGRTLCFAVVLLAARRHSPVPDIGRGDLLEDDLLEDDLLEDDLLEDTHYLRVFTRFT